MTTIFIVITLALITLLWNKIRSFHMDYISPWIEQYCGEKARNICDQVFCVANRIVVPLRRGGRSLWETFSHYIRKSRIEYYKTGEEVFQRKMRTIIATKDQQFRVREITEQIHESELPPQIRKQMYEKNADEADVDALEIIKRKFQAALVNEN